MMQFLISSLQASARPDCAGQRRIGVEGKSKYCLRWKLLKTGGESKASRSTALRIFIRGMRGLLGRVQNRLSYRACPRHAGRFINEVVADGVRMAGRRSVQRG